MVIGVLLSGKGARYLQHPVYFDFDGDFQSDRAVPPPAPFSIGVEVEHVFTTPGEHTVRFTTITEVRRDVDVRATGEVKISVAPQEIGDTAPVASFSAPAVAPVGRPVTFDASASFDPDGGRIARYSWTFDDGTSASEESSATVTHVFDRPAVRRVRLRLVDDEGTSSRVYSQEIIIQAGASAASRDTNRARPFTARLLGVRLGALPPQRGTARRRTQRGVSVRGRFRGRLRDPVRPGDRLLRRLLVASWRARMSTSVDLRTATATARGLALATLRGRAAGRACLRLRITQPTFGPARGMLVMLGGTGAAKTLRVRARFSAAAGRSATLRLNGRVRAGIGRPRGLPAGCRRLVQ